MPGVSRKCRATFESGRPLLRRLATQTFVAFRGRRSVWLPHVGFLPTKLRLCSGCSIFLTFRRGIWSAFASSNGMSRRFSPRHRYPNRSGSMCSVFPIGDRARLGRFPSQALLMLCVRSSHQCDESFRTDIARAPPPLVSRIPLD